MRQPGERGVADLYADARATPGAFVWIGLHEPDETRFTEITSTVGLRPLAVEDPLSDEHRPKLERHEDVTFLVIHAARYVEHAAITETCEIIDTGSVRVFVGDSVVVTVRLGSVAHLGTVRTDLEAQPRMLALGPWAVVHAIVDRIVDDYVDIATAVQTDLDAMEAAVFGAAGGARIGQIYQLKRELMQFRTSVLPLTRPLAMLLKTTSIVPKDLHRYFRDVADHHARVVEQVTNYDDLLNSVLQARLAQVTVDQNHDMRRIASWAAIGAAQTAVAGVYGMNFTYMPELRWRYGYHGILAFMLVSGVLLYRAFRRNGWL